MTHDIERALTNCSYIGHMVQLNLLTHPIVKSTPALHEKVASALLFLREANEILLAIKEHNDELR